MEQKPVATEDFFKGAKPIVMYTQSQLDAMLKAEREKAIRECMEVVEGHDNGYGQADVIDCTDEMQALLSTNESKENEVKG